MVAKLQIINFLDTPTPDKMSLTHFKPFQFMLIEAPPNIYLVKLNNRNIRKRCEICSKLTIKTSERHQ